MRELQGVRLEPGPLVFWEGFVMMAAEEWEKKISPPFTRGAQGKQS